MESPDKKVIIGVYGKTRRRIKSNAAKKGMYMADYVEEIVPKETAE